MNNDGVYKLDTTFRTNECKNKRVIEWILIGNEFPPFNTSVLVWKGKNIEIAELKLDGKFKYWQLKDKTYDNEYQITHWADISRLKPSE